MPENPTLNFNALWLENELSDDEIKNMSPLLFGEVLIEDYEQLAEDEVEDIFFQYMTPLLNSFMHLMYKVSFEKLKLKATENGVIITDGPSKGKYFDIATYTVDFITNHYKFHKGRIVHADAKTDEPDETPIKNIQTLVNKLPQKHIIPNNKLANSLTEDIIDAGQIDLVVSAKGRPEITTRCVLSYEGENVTLKSRQPFTEYDRNVADTVTSLYEYGDQSHIITPATVYRAMVNATEAETPSPQQIGAITKSLDKMRFVRVQIDCSEELKRRKANLNGDQITGGKVDTYLLNMEKIEISAGGQRVTAYKIIKTPILYDYARLVKQVLTVPAALLDIRDESGSRISNNERRISIKSYLLRRISVMKGKTATSNRILFSSLYKDLCEEQPTEKEQRLIREYVNLVLDDWKRKKFIDGYEITTEGRKKTGVLILLKGQKTQAKG